MKKEKYIFGCDRSGVFFGEIIEVKRDGGRYGYAKIGKSRRIRYWTGANCLEELAVSGTEQGEKCQITVTVGEVEVFDLIQLIKCTEKSQKRLEEIKEWTYKN